MRRLNTIVTGLVDWTRRLVLRPDRVTSNRCPECGAGVGKACANPFCYGSLGDVPRGEADTEKSSEKALRAMRAYTGRRTASEFDDSTYADLIADLLHLAASEGHDDPTMLLDQAGNYYDADIAEGGVVLVAVAR
jgi:hypothetical protein